MLGWQQRELYWGAQDNEAAARIRARIAAAVISERRGEKRNPPPQNEHQFETMYKHEDSTVCVQFMQCRVLENSRCLHGKRSASLHFERSEGQRHRIQPPKSPQVAAITLSHGIRA
jgi:hypothetical protein